MSTKKPNIKTADHLKRLLLNRNGTVPNFALLLGAGASKSSHVQVAADMISQWQRQLYSAASAAEPFSEWLSKQRWYLDDDEYGTLFEMVYDQPAQRRVYIEELLRDARPGWGYVYLTNMLKHRLFDVVLTTNFDDLLNEACYLYSDGLRPIVCAHDSAISSVRVTAGRPKIIKLHGDFLFDNIKNTVRELETLESNTKRKIAQFAQEYGLVVVGYGGRDRSVMDTLDVLVRNEEYFCHGVYWCVRHGEALSRRLEAFLRRDRVFLVEIDGFDQLMADLNNAGGFGIPQPLGNFVAVAQERARLFVQLEEPLKHHPVIAADVSRVLRQLDNYIQIEIPKSMQAERAMQTGDVDKGLRLMTEALLDNPEDGSLAIRLGEELAEREKTDELNALLRIEKGLNLVNRTYLLLRAGQNEEVVRVGLEALSREEDPRARINVAIAFKRLGRPVELEEQLRIAEERNAGSGRDAAVSVGIAALRGEKEPVLAFLKDAISQDRISADDLNKWPLFDGWREDPDVREIFEAAGTKGKKSVTARTSEVSAPRKRIKAAIDSVPPLRPH